MSFAQERLWFHDQLQPGALESLLPLALRIRGRLDTAALAGAFQAIVDRHDILRTRYAVTDGTLDAVVDDSVTVTFEHADDAGVLRRELGCPLDLAAGPPFRLTLARLGDDDHLLVFVVHHIAFDGWSWSVLARELAEGYRQRVAGETPAAGPLPLAQQYGDFARWQRGHFTGDRRQLMLDFWRREL